MKKIVALLLIFVMVLSMTACGKKESGTDKSDNSNTNSATESTSEEMGEVEKAEAMEDDEFTHTFSQYGNARIKIVGAEATKNDKGEDLLRVYYDYTNNDNTANGHAPGYVLNFLSVTQDGEERETYDFRSDDESAVAEDLNPKLYVQPGCTNRNTINIRWNPNGGVVKVSCFVMVDSWMYSENEVEPFEFEVDPSALMGAPEPFELPAIPNPTYASGMSASGQLDYPEDSEASINGIELTKDRAGRDLVRVNFTVTNKGGEERTAALMAGVTLYQDGVSLRYADYFDVADADVKADNKAYNADAVAPGDTVECCALFYPRTDSPVEAVIENPNSDKCLGTCFDLKALYDATEAASAADKATMEDMVGVWDIAGDLPDRIIFNEDLTGAFDIPGYQEPFTYIVKDGVLRLTYDNGGDEVEYEISVNGDNLVLIDNIFQEEQTFVRADAN